jgi:hypothetical protein
VGVLYKPRRLPDGHLAVFPQIAISPLFHHRCRRRLSSPRPSPTRAHRRLLPPTSSAAPTSAAHCARYDPDAAPLPDVHILPDSPLSPCSGAGGTSPRRPLFLHEHRHPSARFGSRTVLTGQPDMYVAPRPPLAAPLWSRRPTCMCPDGPPGRALGFGLVDTSP